MRALLTLQSTSSIASVIGDWWAFDVTNNKMAAVVYQIADAMNIQFVGILLLIICLFVYPLNMKPGYTNMIL